MNKPIKLPSEPLALLTTCPVCQAGSDFTLYARISVATCKRCGEHVHLVTRPMYCISQYYDIEFKPGQR